MKDREHDRMTGPEIAEWAVSAITYAPGLLTAGRRDPEKVDVLIHEHFAKGDKFVTIQDAERAMRDVDTPIARVLQSVIGHHTLRFKKEMDGKKARYIPVIATVPASETWWKIIRGLQDFAAQTGGQRMIPLEQCAHVGRGLSEMVREMVAKRA